MLEIHRIDGARILDGPGDERLGCSLAAALPLAFLNIPRFIMRNMPVNFVLDRLVPGFLRPRSGAFERALFLHILFF